MIDDKIIDGLREYLKDNYFPEIEIMASNVCLNDVSYDAMDICLEAS